MRSSHGARRHRRRRKTTALAAVRDAAEREGYQVEGFAPTSRATHKLAEVGIESNTLQRQQDARHRGWRLRRVEHTDAKRNQVTVRTDDERTVNYDPRRLQGVTIYRETEWA